MPAPTGPTLCARRWCLLLHLFLSYSLLFFCGHAVPCGSGGGSSSSCILFGPWRSRLVALPPRWWLPPPYSHCLRPLCPRHAFEGDGYSFLFFCASLCAFFFVIAFFLCPTIPPRVGSSGGSSSSPFYFLAQGALGLWLYLLGGGYSSPSLIACAHHTHAMRPMVVATPPCLP